MIVIGRKQQLLAMTELVLVHVITYVSNNLVCIETVMSVS